MSDSFPRFLARAAVYGLAILLVVFVVGSLGAGLGDKRSESAYTGNVVDIENERGLLFVTTQVHVKTDRRSSKAETFCVHPDNRDQLVTLREGLHTDSRVTITYERPRYVPVWTCEQGTSIITDVETHSEEADA